MGNVLNMGTGDFTLSAWIKTKNTSFENIIKKRGSGAGYAISVNVNGTVYAKINDGTNNVDLTSVGTVNDNQWRHVAGVFDRDGTVTIYIDGQADNSASISSVGNTNNTNNLTLSANSSFFNGVMDDVRIYNRTLSGSEVARLYNQSLSKFNKTPTGILRNGLVGHWTFDGADVNFVTNTASDRSGQGNNGTLLKFDGADDYVNMGDVLDAGSGSMSVSVWIKLRKLSNLSQQIIIKRHSVSPWLSWELYVSSGDEVVFQIANTSADYFNVGTTPIVKDNWYHIVGVKNGNNLTVYLNGEINQSWNTGPVAGTVQNGNRELGIGSDWVDGTYDFNGIIDDVRVYDRALSQGEVSLLYNAAR
ncbi:MAG: LamG domain-containing protein [Candidatus Paceibacter sp.]|nr:LamG domain-containing protein [Candidatus Paceibacter sp.]